MDRMNETTFTGQVIPTQTLSSGDRVELSYDSGDYDGFNFLRAGLQGMVVGFATADIQKRQIWPEESYYVRLDCDTPDSIGRVFNRDRLSRI